MERDQQDPRWLAWVERMDEELAKFLSETVSDMPENPWTAEGLRRAEQAALERFPESGYEDRPENRELVDQFARFLGEVFRRNFEGEWYNVPEYDDENRSRGFGPVIQEGYNPMYLDVIPLLGTAIVRRTGEEWTTIFGYSQQDYAKWVEHGRPPLEEWVNRDIDD
ncbi:hypothetical protein NDR87_21105 [Nocardia sp. CDC159]|uniref:Uncharacterized protein n=1 Tax=Nocardia pulmonis TaxID=2951408 RepID=A0A9X2EE43_9NOCA|nr:MULTISPECIES: hypothetical protein [Nocardia]MCM6776446.1 hypothetical protein [Nocardia pulmonis]MCM6788870.1 hypothetical protein [Nocardia sp. CDC159]